MPCQWTSHLQPTSCTEYEAHAALFSHFNHPLRPLKQQFSYRRWPHSTNSNTLPSPFDVDGAESWYLFSCELLIVTLDHLNNSIVPSLARDHRRNRMTSVSSQGTSGISTVTNTPVPEVRRVVVNASSNTYTVMEYIDGETPSCWCCLTLSRSFALFGPSVVRSASFTVCGGLFQVPSMALRAQDHSSPTTMQVPSLLMTNGSTISWTGETRAPRCSSVR
jgi:hypothetical protein